MIKILRKLLYKDLEGGFYGVERDNGNYLPLNIQDILSEYVGKTISIYSSFSKKDEVSVYMWGKLIYIEFKNNNLYNEFDILFENSKIINEM